MKNHTTALRPKYPLKMADYLGYRTHTVHRQNLVPMFGAKLQILKCKLRFSGVSTIDPNQKTSTKRPFLPVVVLAQ